MKHISNNNRAETYFIDIDGVILKHQGTIDAMLENKPEILPGVLDTLKYWAETDKVVIITTARMDYYRDKTAAQLKEVGLYENIHYRELIMGVTAGKRIVINDAKPDMPDTAGHIILERDTGFLDFPS